MNEFYLSSEELRNYHVKHKCSVIEVVDGDKLHIVVDPVIPSWVYGTSLDLESVVIAPRHVGVSLVPEISEWPCIVNVLVPQEGELRHRWMHLDIGRLTQT